MISENDSVNWGIIGCGDVCEVKSGPAFNKVPHSKLVSVMRRDLSKAQDYAHRHGVPSAYGDAQLLVNDSKVNAIYIATPPSSHEAYTELALKTGKPVYVEKPVTLNAESCLRMIQMERKYNGKVTVAHYRRGLTLFQKVRSLIQEGAIGQVRLVQIRTLQPTSSKFILKVGDNWRVRPEISGGGIFHDLSPHQLDIMYWIFGKPTEVHGAAYNQSQLYDAPDNVTLQARFNNDVILNGSWAFNIATSAAEEKCEVIGDKGKLVFSFFKLGDLEIISDAGSQILPMEYPVNIQQPMIESVVKYFRGEGRNPCSLQEAFEVMTMIDTVAASRS